MKASVLHAWRRVFSWTQPAILGGAHQTALSLALIALTAAAVSCSRDYEKWPKEYEPVSAVVPDSISTTTGTQILFTECIEPAGLEVRLTRQRDSAEALLMTITGTLSSQGCITDATLTPAYSLEDGASYTLSVSSPVIQYSKVVSATSVFTYRPGLYLMVNTDHAVLEESSEQLRTWWVEFGEPDADGVFDLWLVDADPPEEQRPPVCLGWSAQPTSDGGGIGWKAQSRGVLNETRDLFSTPTGQTLDIDVQPIACIKGAHYESQGVPSGETLSGWMAVDRLEIPCGVTQEVDKVYYTGRRCPDGTVLPHE